MAFLVFLEDNSADWAVVCVCHTNPSRWVRLFILSQFQLPCVSFFFPPYPQWPLKVSGEVFCFCFVLGDVGAFHKSLLVVDTYSVPYHLPVVAVSTLNEVSRKFHVGLSLEKVPAYLPFQLCVQTLKCMPQHMCGGQRTTFITQFSSSIMCVVDIKLSLSVLVAIPPSHLAGIWFFEWTSFLFLWGPVTFHFGYAIILTISPHTHTPSHLCPHCISRFAGVSFNKSITHLCLFSKPFTGLSFGNPSHTHPLYSTVYTAISLYASFPKTGWEILWQAVSPWA